jgi:hypothetical protein
VSEIKIIIQEQSALNEGKRKVDSIAAGLTIAGDDVDVIASRDDLVQAGKESIIKKLFLLPFTFFRKIIEFYWG